MLGELCQASRMRQVASLLPEFHRVDEIIDALNINYLKIVEIGRKARQVSTDVRTGRRGQPTQITKHALVEKSLP